MGERAGGCAHAPLCRNPHSSVAIFWLQVNLGGREINVGRPKGYIEPPPGSKQAANKVRRPELDFTLIFGRLDHV